MASQGCLAGQKSMLKPCGYHKVCFRPIVGSGRTRSGRSTTVMQTSPKFESVPPTRRTSLQLALALGVLAANTQAAGAITVPECEQLTTAGNGIQFCDTKEGTGKAPAKGALIRCHYRGRLASNNAIFDSSYERGRPLSFKIGVRQVIAGWDVGILGDQEQGIPPMKEGGKRTLIIPAELAYGDRGAGGIIPPKATLIFDVELLGKR
ncbi:g3010 [Coccomyxa viridis]|uniref:peptidylprolyl isomerase n=1 Tax=Coccomyxa viridis TaxID=1274662 RepID=A0ABP1FLS7_9CHLO